MTRIVVAGGAGFLGSHLCDRLIAEGHAVVCVDNLHTGNLENIEHLRGHARFQFRRHSILDPLDLPGRIDAIYNLACPASPQHYQRDPHYTVMVNVLGVSRLMALARNKKAQLLQTSTSEVYGDPLEASQCEEDRGHVNCTGPRACYDEGKRCAEALLFDEFRRRRGGIKVARIFNTYGPRMDEGDGRVISNFMTQVLNGEPVTVFGDGSQTRSFCYVDDLIEGLVRLMASPEAFAGPVNLGNPAELTCLELAQRIAAIAGVRPRIAFKPLPVDDPRRRRPDIALAQRALGWKPRIGLDEGLRRTLAYYRSRMAADVEAPGAAALRAAARPALKPAAV